MSTIQVTPTALEAARLDFPKTGMRQFQVRYAAVIAGAGTDAEIFIDGIAGKRLGLPVSSAVIVRIDMIAYEFTTATGAFSAAFGSSGALIGATHSNAGTVAIIGAAVAGTLLPAAQTTVVPVLAIDNTNKTVRVGITTTGAGTTKVVEVIANVVVSNHFPQVTGAIN